MKVKILREKRLSLAALAAAGVDTSGDGNAIKASVSATFGPEDVFQVGDTRFNAEQLKAFQVEKVSDKEVLVRWVEEGEADDAPHSDAPKGATAPSTSKTVDYVVPQAVVDRAVETAVKRLGITPHSAGTVNTDVTVKSAEQRMYENEIAMGRAKFETYAAAKAFGDYSRYLVSIMDLKKGFASQGSFGKQLQANREIGAKSFEAAFRRKAEVFSESAGVYGGGLVAEEFMPDVIRNVALASPVRKLAKVLPMSSESLIIPRRTAGITGYWINDNTPSVTASVPRTDNVTLLAKTWVAKAPVSRQLLADGGTIVGDLVMEELAYAAALAESNAYLLGDGTSTYGGISGIVPKYGTTATDGGYIVVGGDTSDVHTAAHLASLMGRLPAQYHQNGVFACSGAMLANVFDRLGAASGGTTWTERKGFGYVPEFAGRPIVLCDQMNSDTDTGTDTIDVLYGDFSRASVLGDRMQLEIATSEDEAFSSYQVVFRGVARLDINVHDVGSGSAAGPVVALFQT